MASPEESFQENSESERQAVISAQQVASSLQSDMSQASSDCNSWKDGVWRLTKEVAEQSTKRIAGRAPRITHLFIHKHQEQTVRNPSRRQKKFIHHFSRCDPQKAIRGSMFCRLLLLYRTHDQWTLKIPQKGKKQRNSNLSSGRKRQEWNPFWEPIPAFLRCQAPCLQKALVHEQQTSTSRMGGMTQSGEYMSKAYRILQSLTRRWARAELRTEQRIWFCELPDSPDNSEYAPSSNKVTRHIHQPRRIDLPAQKKKVKEKSPNKRR